MEFVYGSGRSFVAPHGRYRLQSPEILMLCRFSYGLLLR